jgi:nitrite reductase/ring-hydroxylating ferredoxin subunit
MKESKENFVKLCKVSEIPERKGIRFEIEDHDIAVFKIDGEIFVISNVCPHNHTSLMFNGHLVGHSISCPVHGWKFDLRTGKTLSNNSNIKTYETKIIDEYLFVNLPRRIFNW